MTAEQLKRATIALHRYYIWANKMRDHFIEKVPLVMKLPDPKDRFAPECIEADMYMSFWYSALYVVIEGWVRLELTDPTIDVLLASPNVGFLKQYRHGVSHFQANYFDEKFLGLMRRQATHLSRRI
jgi:hypothetical protein